jgi:hypothetical protein
MLSSAGPPLGLLHEMGARSTLTAPNLDGRALEGFAVVEVSIGSVHASRTVSTMTTEQQNQNSDAEMDALLSELQTYGDIEALLRAGLSVEQVVALMIFRAQLIDLIYRGITAHEPASEHAAAALNEFIRDLELDVLATGHSDPEPVRYGSTAELLAACQAVVSTLQNTEAPEFSTEPVTHASFLAIFAEARPILPTRTLISEIALQVSDIQASSGAWRIQHMPE